MKKFLKEMGLAAGLMAGAMGGKAEARDKQNPVKEKPGVEKTVANPEGHDVADVSRMFEARYHKTNLEILELEEDIKLLADKIFNDALKEAVQELGHEPTSRYVHELMGANALRETIIDSFISQQLSEHWGKTLKKFADVKAGDGKAGTLPPEFFSTLQKQHREMEKDALMELLLKSPNAKKNEQELKMMMKAEILKGERTGNDDSNIDEKTYKLKPTFE